SRSRAAARPGSCARRRPLRRPTRRSARAGARPPRTRVPDEATTADAMQRTTSRRRLPRFVRPSRDGPPEHLLRSGAGAVLGAGAQTRARGTERATELRPSALELALGLLARLGGERRLLFPRARDLALSRSFGARAGLAHRGLVALEDPVGLALEQLGARARALDALAARVEGAEDGLEDQRVERKDEQREGDQHDPERAEPRLVLDQ